MTFNPITQPTDKILLADRESPGIAVVTNASSPRKWDERRGYALSGARVVFRGLGLAKPIVTLRLLTDEDFEDWHAWRDLVQRPPIGRRQTALDIWHPILEDLGITQVVVEDVGQPNQVADGEWNIMIKFIEFRRPRRVPASPIDASEATQSGNQQAIQNLTGILQDERAIGDIGNALAPAELF